MANNLANMLKKHFPDAAGAKLISENYFIDTGIEVLNYIISGKLKGGINLNGRFTTIFGAEGSSKTTIALNIIAQAQQKYNAQVLYIDSESTVTVQRCQQMGINTDDENFFYVNPNHMEEAFDIIEKVATQKIKDNDDTPLIIVFDSVSATTTMEESSRDSSQLEMATQAKSLTRNIRRVRPLLHKLPHTGCILISQARVSMDQYAPDTIHPTGGKALSHEAVALVRVAKSKNTATGQIVKLSTIKNKLFSPYQKVEINFDYNKCFTKEARIESLCELLKNIGFVGQSGAWAFYPDELKKLIIDNKFNLDKDGNEIFDVEKKFYLKDFSKQLIDNDDFYNAILDVADDYIKNNIIFVTEQCKDEEVENLDKTNVDNVIEVEDPAEQMFKDMESLK